MPSTSQLVDRYRLTAELGRGGMGVVWEAYDELLHREVAVKELHFPPDLSDQDREHLADRTLREARAVAAVDTPAAVRVFDIVEQDGRPWIVMELVRGHTLTDRLRERSHLSPLEVAEIGLSVLEALEVAHGAGVLHRDVKPSNVLLGVDGRTALTDFGIATVDGDGSDVTTTGVIVGSPAYVAPERLRGQASSPASDIWSLGATLWTAVEGRPPYAGDSPVAVMSAVAMTDPPGCTRCGGRLTPLLRQMMDRDPSRRPDAAAVRAVLTDIVERPADGDRGVADPYPTEPLPASFDRTRVIDATTTAGPAVSPVTSAHPSASPPRPRRRRPLLVAGALIAVVVAAAIALVIHGSGHSGSASAKHKRSGGASAGSAGADLPAGWTRYTDPQLGWSIAVPSSWQRATSSEGTRFTDPDGGRYALVATRYPAGSSSVSAWQDSERTFESRHQDYQRIRLEPVKVAGARDAADWEFTYVDGGAALHALDHGTIYGNRGFAVFIQSHADQWSSSSTMLKRIARSLRPGS